MISSTAKKAAGYFAADLIENDQIVGIGTGSTTFFFIEKLAQRIKEGLKITAIASSKETENLAKNRNIPLLDPKEIRHIDITVDGADEIDSKKCMIKGGGGALLREKIVASSSKEFIVIIDHTKRVSSLGNHLLPIEIIPFCYLATIKKIEDLGYRGQLRETPKQSPFITDNGNFIFDVRFNTHIDHPKKVHEALICIPGILETGLFFDLAKYIIVGFDDGHIEKIM